MAEEAKIELERGVRVGQTTEALLKIYDLLQKGKFADASVETYNSIKAIDSFFERPAPVLRICACFINREGEDVRYLSDDDVRAKIEDWKEEGLSMESFFLLALIFISEETADLKKFSEKIKATIQNFASKTADGKLNSFILD
jgi:hypothetical protein